MVLRLIRAGLESFDASKKSEVDDAQKIKLSHFATVVAFTTRVARFFNRNSNDILSCCVLNVSIPRSSVNQ